MIRPKKEKQVAYKFEDDFVKPKPLPKPVTPPPTPPVAEQKEGTLLDALSNAYNLFKSYSYGVSKHVPIVRTADTLFGRNEGLTPEQIAEKYSLKTALGREPTKAEQFAETVGGILPMLIGGAYAKTPLQMAGIGGGISATGAYGGGGTNKDVMLSGLGGMLYIPGMHYATKATSGLLGKFAPNLGNAGLQGLVKGVATDVGGAIGGTAASGLATAPFTGQLPTADEFKANILANVALNRAGSYLANKQFKAQEPPAPTERVIPQEVNQENISFVPSPGKKMRPPKQGPLPQEVSPPVQPLPEGYKRVLSQKNKMIQQMNNPIEAMNLQNIPKIPEYGPRIKIPEPIKLSPEILNETQKLQKPQTNILENKTNMFEDLQHKLNMLKQSKINPNLDPLKYVQQKRDMIEKTKSDMNYWTPEKETISNWDPLKYVQQKANKFGQYRDKSNLDPLKYVQQKRDMFEQSKTPLNKQTEPTLTDLQKTQDMPLKTTESIKTPTQPTKGIKREILNAKSNVGNVERVGDFVYKPTTSTAGYKRLESEVYKNLKNVEGIATGTTVKRGGKEEIKTPYYEKVISTEMPTQDKSSVTKIIENNVDRINKAINELTNKNYNYSDPLQFGINKDGKLDLLGFGNTTKGDKYFDSKIDNYDRLKQFYTDFGLEKQAKIIEQGMNLKPKDNIKPNNIYYTESNKTIPKSTEIGQTKAIDGVKYVYSEKPIPQKTLDNFGLKKLYEAPIQKPKTAKELIKEQAPDLEFELRKASLKEKPKNRPVKAIEGESLLSEYAKGASTKKELPKSDLEDMLKGLGGKKQQNKKGFENFTESDINKYKDLIAKEKNKIELHYKKMDTTTPEKAKKIMQQKRNDFTTAQKMIKDKIIKEINKRNTNNSSKKKMNDDGTVEERLEENIKFINKEPPKYKYTYENPEMEDTHNKYYGLKKESFLNKIKETAIDLKKGFTNPIKEIEVTEKNAEAENALLNMPKIKSIAIDTAKRNMETIVEKLSFEDNNVLGRKIQLDDMMEDIQRKLPLPHNWTAKDVQNELKRIESYLTPEVKQGLDKYRNTLNQAKEAYIKASEDLGIPNMREILDREMYFRHMILTAEGEREVKTSGGKSSTKISTNRSFLQERKGKGITNTNYLEPTFEMLWQMENDTLLMKELKRIEPYSIHEEVKQNAKQKKLKNWKDAIPEGYTDYQFKDDNFFFLTRSIPDEIAQMLITKNLKKLKIPSIESFPEVLATGRKGGEWVMPKEIAIGLEKIGNQTKEIKNKNILTILNKLYLRATGEWKEIALYKNPYNFFKYNIRNQTGDLDLLIRNRFNLNEPVEATKKALELTKKSAKEIIRAYQTGKFTKDLKDYYDLGGWQILTDITDVSQVTKNKAFDFAAKEIKPSALDTPKKVIDGYVTMVRDLTQIREMTNRYSLYKDILVELKNSPDGLPKNYMSSKPERIKGLKTVERRAFQLANDVFLNYGYTSEYGKLVAKYIFPFWKFPESNARSTWQFVKNSMTKPEVAESIGKKFGIVAPEIAKRLGITLLRLSAFGGMASAWNLLTQGDNVKDVPDDVKKRSYITIFKDALGETKYFSNIGSTTEVLEWFGLGSEPSDFEALWRGDMSIKEYLSVMRIADKLADAPKDVANKLVSMLNPIIKFVAEFPSGKKFFPDAFNPINIKDRGQYLAEIVGLTDVYKYVTGKPSKPGWELLNPANLILYKATAKKSAYDSVNNMVRKYLESVGKATKGYSENERSEALYYYKQALKYKDKTASEKYLKKYFSLGGKRKDLKQALKNLHPLSSMTVKDRRLFMSKLTPKEREKVNLAIQHYKDLLAP